MLRVEDSQCDESVVAHKIEFALLGQMHKTIDKLGHAGISRNQYVMILGFFCGGLHEAVFYQTYDLLRKLQKQENILLEQCSSIRYTGRR